ncbi:LysM peptidoglycan-binding domain-containing protein [Oleiharenicola lentus]|uniref:LysM peptidoglycan-binding domain-containing protein n=1 Tax=Oleiharenicola lentus TaxID=2508720 RepID=UPI003F667B11
MKILQIFGAVVAVHVLAFIFIFASPGCQSGPRNVPTPDATSPSQDVAPVSFNTPTPVDLGPPASTTTSGYAAPTRPGSPNAAAVTPAKPAPEVAPITTYTVTRGDSLWSIAKKNNMSVSELARMNNLTTNSTLQPGKKLVVPGKAAAVASPQDLTTTTASTTPAEKSLSAEKSATKGELIKHTVLPGEVLGVIARKYGVTVGALVAENNITNPANVRAGQTLNIPGGRRANGTSKPATATAANGAATATPTGDTSTPPAETPPAASNVQRFELAPPPPGQDLDAGLKNTTTEEVPTLKLELPSVEQPPKK